MTTPLLHQAVLVEIDGKVLTGAEATAVTQILVQQRVNAPALCEVTLLDADPPRLDTHAGAPLRVMLRDGRTLFDGEVTAHVLTHAARGAREIRIRGYDRLHRLRKRQPLKAHLQVTTEELARDLGTDDFAVQAAQPGPMWRRLLQHRQTDFELLHDIAQRSGLWFALKDSVLQLTTPEGTGEPVTLTLGENLHQLSVERNADASTTSVMTLGYDAMRALPLRALALDAQRGTSIEPGVAAKRFGCAGERTLTHRSVRDDDEAVALAQAELDCQAAREVLFQALANGDPLLAPLTPVEVERAAPPLCGRYVPTTVTHRITAHEGYLCELDNRPPRPPSETQGVIATLGTVTSVDDPDALGRIQCTLPACGDLESDWMQIAAPAAGNGKGLIALPAPGDSVLVLGTDLTTGQGFVLGSVFAERGLPDARPDGNKVQRFALLTPDGQKLSLDDSTGTIRIENRDGSYVELSPKTVRLHASCDLVLEAPGNEVTIRGKRIDFRKG